MTDTPKPEPEALAADLGATILQAIADPGHVIGPKPEQSRLIDWQAGAVAHVLRQGGWVMDGVPPVQQVLADARQFSDELVLTKLVARVFRTLILGGLVIPETPQAMTWMRTYIDGDDRRHGPLGKPMVWPDGLPTVVQLLRDWGFQPTPTPIPYVSLRPGGPATRSAPDPTGPDPAMVKPVPTRRELIMGSLLDEVAGAPLIMAVDRMTAIRAMSDAFDRGATHLVEFGVFDPTDGTWLWSCNRREETGAWGDRKGAARWSYEDAVSMESAVSDGECLIVALPPVEDGEEG